MKIYRIRKELEMDRARVPSHVLTAIFEAMKILAAIFGSDLNRTERGYVVLVEKDDTEETVKDHLGRFLFNQSLEGGFVRHGCLHTVTIWGNAGDGIAWIFPDEDGYATVFYHPLIKPWLSKPTFFRPDLSR